jgi:hypothetical protein
MMPGMQHVPAPKAKRVYLLVEVECVKDVPDLADKVAGRAYTLDGVEGAMAILLDTKDSYWLAKSQMEKKP